MKSWFDIKGFSRYAYNPIDQLFKRKRRGMKQKILGYTTLTLKEKIIKVETRSNRKGNQLVKDNGLSQKKFVYFDELVLIDGIYEIVKRKR